MCLCLKISYAHVENRLYNRKIGKKFFFLNGILTTARSQCSHFVPPENTRKPRFSCVFGGYKMGTLARNGLSILCAALIRGLC